MKIIIPRGKNVLVKPDGEESRVTDSGLLTPNNVEQEQKAIGTVIAIGSEIKDIKNGAKVIYGVFAGDDLELEGVKYKLIDEEFILAFLENKV